MSRALDTRPRSPSGGRLVAFVAAHNQEAEIEAALKSLARRTRPPDEVIVVADRCTDRTAEIAVAHGARVFHTVSVELGEPGPVKPSLQVSVVDLPPPKWLPVNAHSDMSDFALPRYYTDDYIYWKNGESP